MTDAELDALVADPKTFVTQARRQGKSLTYARIRVRAVAEGATINGTYGLLPGEALEAFRSDLLLILGGPE